MKQGFLKRLYKLKERLYLEAKYLAEYGFNIGQPIRWEIDHTNRSITVIAVDSSKKHVAKTTQKTGSMVPVIDIKAQEVKQFFSQHKNFTVEIRHGNIVFTVQQQESNHNVISIEEVRECKKTYDARRYCISVNEFANAAGETDMFGLFRATRKEMHNLSSGSFTSSIKQKAIKMLSLFSGCGSLDKAFLDEKYDIKFANDRFEPKALRDHHIRTYRENIGDHIIMRDVMEFTQQEIPHVDVVVAGVPCVTFSALNTINNFRDSRSDLHSIIEQTINIIQWSKAKAFLLENVANFLTVKGGAILKRIKERLKNFGLEAKLINATSLGSAQSRTRSFLVGIQGRQPEIILPNLVEVNTVGKVFEGIEGVNQQDLHFVPTEKMLERMKHVPQGGNINSVPEELRAPRKRFSNYCQRLSETGFSPTITHVQDDAFIHPTLDRYLTVRETARLFSLPDDFTFFGSLTAIFEQLKNCVDYKVSRFLASEIKRQLQPII